MDSRQYLELLKRNQVTVGPHGADVASVMSNQAKVASTRSAVSEVDTSSRSTEVPLGKEIDEREGQPPLNAEDSFFTSDQDVPFYKSDRVLRDQILLILRQVMDPDLHRDIVSCNFVKKLKFDYDSHHVSFTLELTTMACPVKDQFVEECTYRLKGALEWVHTVDITVTAKTRQQEFAGDAEKNIKGVSFIIAVASCKGGVGKSSMAVNLAYMLKRQGARVGLVDCDVYGPSLSSLIPLENPKVYFAETAEKDEASRGAPLSIAQKEGALIPLEHDGVKLMSYSYFRPESDAYAAVRGPIASSLVYQMVTQTAWGELEYLILDTPPGTGDIHLTLAQSVKITGAVVVTTPQRLALVDVEKGIAFFQKLNIPTLAVIENMSYVECPGCGKETPLFGSQCITVPGFRDGLSTTNNTPVPEPTSCRIYKHTSDVNTTTDKRCDCENDNDCNSDFVYKKTNVSSLAMLIEQWGVGVTQRFPVHRFLSATTFKSADTNAIAFPFANVFDDSTPVWTKMREFTNALTREISATVYGGAERIPEVTTTSDGMIQLAYVSQAGEHCVTYVPCREARLQCRCAECCDEVTQERLINARTIPIDIYAKSLKQSNNYAVRIEWSDNHSSLLSFQSLLSMGSQQTLRNQPDCGNVQDLLNDW